MVDKSIIPAFIVLGQSPQAIRLYRQPHRRIHDAFETLGVASGIAGNQEQTGRLVGGERQTATDVPLPGTGSGGSLQGGPVRDFTFLVDDGLETGFGHGAAGNGTVSGG